MATNGSFYWNELMTRDAEAAKKFYGATLGWTFEPMEGGEGPTYWVAKAGDESVAEPAVQRRWRESELFGGVGHGEQFSFFRVGTGPEEGDFPVVAQRLDSIGGE